MNKQTIKKNGRSETFTQELNGEKIVTKMFDRNSPYLKNSIFAKELFSDKKWFAKCVNSGDNFFSTKYYKPEYRLDKIVKILDEKERTMVAMQILEAMLEIYIAGYSHRDIHAKNVFYVDGQIKIIDFEYLKPHMFTVPFLESYDITGRYLSSPCRSDRMCYTKYEDSSISNCLGVNVEDVLMFLKAKIMVDLRAISKTFRKKDKYHTRSKGATYGSFNTKHFRISVENAQRDTWKRLSNFKVTNKHISNKSILDLGSNTGSIGFCLEKYKPYRYLGIEYIQEQVDIANKISAINGYTNIEFMQKDIDNISRFGKFDTVFCLAINKHVKDEDKLYQILGQVTGETLFFEGNAGTNIEEVKSKLTEAGFKNIEYIGMCDDDIKISNHNRPMFVATK